MAELNKKQSFSIDMTKDVKQELSALAKNLRLPQGDAIGYLLKQRNVLQHRLDAVQDDHDLMKTMIGQQNLLIKTIQEQNALLQALAENIISK